MKIQLEFPQLEKKIVLTSTDENEWKSTDDYKISIKRQDNESPFEVTEFDSFYSVISKESFLECFLNQFKIFEYSKTEELLSGVETEYYEDDESIVPKPDFDPELIRLDPRVFSILDIKRFMDKKRIDLSPDFQRNFVWKEVRKKSRLIESLLLRIPLPAFYLAEDKEGTYQVVDGLQRLSVISEFLDNKLRLKELEYLDTDCGNKTFEELSLKYKNRIEDTQLSFNVIAPTTPFSVKFEIFKRLNQGGVPLSHQEIRNSMVKKNIREFIRKLADSQQFKNATDNSIKPLRMEDQDFILRFIGFFFVKIKGVMSYKPGMENFLNDVVEYINNNANAIDFYKIEQTFYNSMTIAHHLFGGYAFRKYTSWSKRRPPVNKAMFVTWSVTLATYDLDEIKNKIPADGLIETLKNEFDKSQDDSQYFWMMTHGTSSIANIDYGFEVAKRIMDVHTK